MASSETVSLNYNPLNRLQVERMTDLSTGGSMRSSVIKLAGQDLLRVVHGHFWAVPSPCRRSAWGVKTRGIGALSKWRQHCLHDAVLAWQVLKLRDPHFSIFEDRADFEPAAHSFNVFGQGADTDIGPVLNLRDLSLIDPEDFGKLQLRHLLRLAQLIERHCGQTLLEPVLNPPPPIGRHRFQQFTKIASGHYMLPSFLSSSTCRSKSRSAIGTNFSYQRSSPVFSPPIKRIAERSGLNA